MARPRFAGVAIAVGLAIIASFFVATTATAAPAATVVVPTVVAASAKASNSPLMKRSEYKKIKKGMTRAKVKRIVGSAGKIWECSPAGACSTFFRSTKHRYLVNITFKKGKVVKKYGFPGERLDYIYDALY